MRSTADWLSPSSAASERVDQWVAPLGVRSRVATITCSTWASVTVRGRPGRGSSTRPSRRSATKRRRHLAAMRARDPQPLGDLGVLQALGRGEHHPRAHRESLGARSPPRPGLQLLALLVAQDNGYRSWIRHP